MSESAIKVGYTWYPNDWKNSDTFLDIDDPLVRYFYREILDLLWMNRGRWEENKGRFEKVQRTKISAEKWAELKALFSVEIDGSGGCIWTHKGVTDRMDKRAVTSAENGVKGGRPKDGEKPKNNLTGKPNDNLTEPKEPVNRKESKRNITKPNVNEGLVISTNTGNGKPRPTLPPLWAASLRSGPFARLEAVEKYANKLEEVIEGKPEQEKREEIFRFFLPVEQGPETDETIKKFFARSSDMMTAQTLTYLVGWLRQSEDFLRTGTHVDLVVEHFVERFQKVVRP
jgi:hypothetical protein